MGQPHHVAESLKTLVGLDFEKTSLDNVLAYLSEVVPGLNVVIDPEIELAGIDLSTRVVDLKVKAVSVETVLRLVLGADLGYKVEENRIWITTCERLYRELRIRTFDAADIAASVSAKVKDAAYADEVLRDLVQRMVNNASDPGVAVWAEEGGPASVEVVGGKVVVTQTEQGFRKIDGLLAGLRETAKVPIGSPRTVTAQQPSKVFVAHGHDLGAKEEVARFLETLDLGVVVVGEQGRGLLALIETIERNAWRSDFAVVLLTPDDLGARKEDIESEHAEAAKIECLEPRARQNVVFELGYMAGVLGRDRVYALRKGSLKIFSEWSDLHGGFCPEMDVAGGWKNNLAKALKNAGFDIDLNKLAD